MTRVEKYGRKHLCKICKTEPAMTQVDYSRKYTTKTSNKEAATTRLIIYGQKRDRGICFFCDRNRKRDAFQETLAEKKAANRAAIGDMR
jgi:hypothetical protein